jgi:hypothetical protein
MYNFYYRMPVTSYNTIERRHLRVNLAKLLLPMYISLLLIYNINIS